MTKRAQIWKCNICGNIVEVLHEGSDALVCCGQRMDLIKENTVDAAKEKHIPIIEKINNEIFVKVGAVEHPMTKEHYIEWIELTNSKDCKKFLKPGEKPEAKFGSHTDKPKARAYCNLHGLWMSK